MHVGSISLAAGADYVLLGPRSTELRSQKPVVAICAVRTGSGKSQTTRHVAAVLRGAGKRVAVLRHPMPYGDLTKQAVQRFERYEDGRSTSRTWPRGTSSSQGSTTLPFSSARSRRRT
jgi:predicted GTPase